ncbi:unnamed protein product [Calypogeia fissa]
MFGSKVDTEIDTILPSPTSSSFSHSLSWSPQCQSSMGAVDLNLFPRVAYPGEHVPDDNAAANRIPFMQLMAVPKRKVSPSRRGKWTEGSEARASCSSVQVCF